MTQEQYIWTDNPTVSGESVCDTDVLNDCLMYLKKEKADINFSNITPEAEKHFLNKTQITNCILEIPQRIKLELNNGTLTIKAGSVVTVPNGFESDGTTPRFDYVTIDADKTYTYSFNQERLVVLHANKSINSYERTIMFSQATTPTFSGNYAYWYDTTNNVIKYTANAGSTWTSEGSFPFVLTQGNTSGITTIKQVFNGFGYIGSTVWVDKGVKFSVPNGRNTDGSLRDIEVTYNWLRKLNYTDGNGGLRLFASSIGGGTDINYDPQTNYNYRGKQYTKDNIRDCIYISLTTDSNGKVTSMTQPQTVDLIKRSDLESGLQFRTVVDTYVNGTSWYRVWSDGWIEQGGSVNVTTSGQTVTFLKPFSTNNYSLFCQSTFGVGGITGTNVIYNSTGAFTVNSFQVKTPSNNYALWFACGY